MTRISKYPFIAAGLLAAALTSAALAQQQPSAADRYARTLAEVMGGADVFLGLSAGGVLKPEMVKTMAQRPLILALANPTPEILPEEVRKVRDDVVMATGRSDYPNQVNNVLCFPYIDRKSTRLNSSHSQQSRMPSSA